MSNSDKARLAKAALLAEHPDLTVAIQRGTFCLLIVHSERAIELPDHILGVRVKLFAPAAVAS